MKAIFKECEVLHKVLRKTKMNNWCSFDLFDDGTLIAYDLEASSEISVKDALKDILDGLDCQENFDNCDLTPVEQLFFKRLIERVGLPKPRFEFKGIDDPNTIAEYNRYHQLLNSKKETLVRIFLRSEDMRHCLEKRNVMLEEELSKYNDEWFEKFLSKEAEDIVDKVNDVGMINPIFSSEISEHCSHCKSRGTCVSMALKGTSVRCFCFQEILNSVRQTKAKLCSLGYDVKNLPEDRLKEFILKKGECNKK